MRLLVTRPEPDAMKLAGLLEERGHEATVEPLMRASFENCDPIDLEGAAALIATSHNGLRALAGTVTSLAARALPIFVVGRGTARHAQRLGFKQILVGGGTAANLVPAIAATLEPSAGLLVHLAGDRLAFDVKGELEQLGFRVVQPTVYRMEPAEALSESTRNQINDGEIDGAILMSPRTAGIYARLVGLHGLVKPATRLYHFCLSSRVAIPLHQLGQMRIVVPDRPVLEDLLADIELTAAQWDE